MYNQEGREKLDKYEEKGVADEEGLKKQLDSDDEDEEEEKKDEENQEDEENQSQNNKGINLYIEAKNYIFLSPNKHNFRDIELKFVFFLNFHTANYIYINWV